MELRLEELEWWLQGAGGWPGVWSGCDSGPPAQELELCVFGGSSSCVHVCEHMCNSGQLFSCVQIVCWRHLAGVTCALVPHTGMCLFTWADLLKAVCVCVHARARTPLCDSACVRRVIPMHLYVCARVCVPSGMTVWIHV